MPPPDALCPSGFQAVLRHGDQEVTVVEVGGGLRRYTVAGVDVLDGYQADELCQSGRGQLLLPWPNRLDGGRYEVDGATLQTPLSEAEKGNAIHGLTRFANWHVAESAPARVRMAYRLHPQAGYPFLLDLSAEYRLGDEGLQITISAVNRGERPCPYGAGAHPYLRLGDGLVDGLDLQVPAATVLDSDERGIPVGRRPVAGTADDFRTARLVGDARLDSGYTDLLPGGDGRTHVELHDPASGRRLTLWAGEGITYLMVFTGDTVAVERRRHGLAVEPMTCAPNAFRSGDGLQWLQPGQATTASWGITPSWSGAVAR